MDFVYKTKQLCSGCTACQWICKKHAISMISDDKGFLYPAVDKNRCVNCGACQSVCQTYDDKSIKSHERIYYKAVTRDNDALLKSQSGGMFTVISDYILENGGIVYGAVFQGPDQVIHKRTETLSGRNEMRGSKYVQSDLQDVFAKIRKDLMSDRLVLFSGTPCQCDGLKRFLEKTKSDMCKLLIVDLICHGVPSPLLWKDYIKYKERKHKGKIDKIIFRDKTFGWFSHYESFWIKQRKYSSEEFKNLFNSNICLRNSCYNCLFSNLNRVGDITIGDAWKTKRTSINRETNSGQSMLIINTFKGVNVFNSIKEKIKYEQIKIEDYMQPQLLIPTHTNDNTEYFWNAYKRYGYGYINFIFGKSGRFNKVYKIIRRKIINIISK